MPDKKSFFGMFKSAQKRAADLASGARAKIQGISDPSKDPGMVNAAMQVEHEIDRLRDAFDWKSTYTALNASKSEITPLASLVYSRAVKRVWADSVLEAKERKYLNWLQEALELTQDEVSKIRFKEESRVLKEVLYASFEDGVIDNDEIRRVQSLIGDMGKAAYKVSTEFLKESGWPLLQKSLERVAFENRDGVDGMKPLFDNVIKLVGILGIHGSEIAEPLRQAGMRVLAVVLNECEVAERLTAKDEEAIDWILEAFRLPLDHRDYARERKSEIRLIEDFSKGKLPTVGRHLLNDWELKTSEIVHCHIEDVDVECKWRTPSGESKDEDFSGTLLITNLRILFMDECADREWQVSYRSLTNMRIHQESFTYTKGKKTFTYEITDEDRISLKVLRRVKDLANKRVGNDVDGLNLPSRHISKDVRQRVWTDYGGRCAECGSTLYLEFDHIIPHSKGGSNEANNIQLLCRKCNLEKSDSI